MPDLKRWSDLSWQPMAAHRGLFHRLTPVHVTAREDPLPPRGVDGAPHQDDAALQERNGAGRHLRVLVPDEAAGGTDGTLAALDQAQPQRAAALRAEAGREGRVDVAFIVRCGRRRHPPV